MNLLDKNILIEEMKKVFGTDTKRINHALSVLDFSEQIQSREGGRLSTIQAAAIFHDIGIHEAERKYGSSAGNYQEIEGPPIARQILTTLEFDPDDIEHICKIIANHHSAKNIDTLEFRIIWDADLIVNLKTDFAEKSPEILQKLIEKNFRTAAGREIASRILIH
jgi:HD superfamily phosphodiesterase